MLEARHPPTVDPPVGGEGTHLALELLLRLLFFVSLVVVLAGGSLFPFLAALAP